MKAPKPSSGTAPRRLVRQTAWLTPALVLVLMAIPISVLAWLLVAEMDRGIERAEQGTRGLERLLPLAKTARLIGLHRGLSFSYLNGNAALASRLNDVEALVDAAWTEVAATEAHSVVRPAHALAPTAESWRAAAADWERLRTAGRKLSAASSFNQHTQLVRKLNLLEAEVLESSGLLFAARPAEHFMIDATLIRLPRLLEELGQLRGRVAGSPSNSPLSDSDERFVAHKIESIREDLAQLLASVAASAKYNRAAGERLVQLEPAFSDAVQSFLKANELRQRTGRSAPDGELLFALGSTAIDAGTRYIDVAETNLKLLLEQTATELRQNKSVALGISALIAALMFAISAFLVRTVIAQEALRRSRTELEQRVAERTQELQRINQQLAAEVEVRKRTETHLAQRSDELARSNAELEQFAYVASHDLQEPLRMVSNYLQLIERRYRDKIDADATEFIAFAVDGAKRMQALINDLLAFSRVGTRGAPFAPAALDDVLQVALRNLRIAVEESGAVVTGDALPTVWGDSSQLVQLLQNLLANAIKFRGDRKPVVHISAEPDGRYWRVSVHDNGIGIAPEYFTRIFVLFQRLHGIGTYPGTGIGLAICKKIVERHGGKIWVESHTQDDEHRGSTFLFTLPKQGGNGS